MITKFKRNLKQQTWRIRVSQSRMKQEITEKMEELALLRLCKATLPSGEQLGRRESEKKNYLRTSKKLEEQWERVTTFRAL